MSASFVLKSLNLKALGFHCKITSSLVEDTGRIIRGDKRGIISHSSQHILDRLNIPAENWLKITEDFGHLFKGTAGSLQALSHLLLQECEHLERKRR
jgi:hypothetical protein